MSRKLRAFPAIVLCIILFSSAALALQVIMEYRIADKLYEDSAAKFTAAAESENSSGKAEGQREDVAPLTVDFDALCSVNGDIAGWIYCEGTDINYPVLQGRDNDYYLDHTYDGAPGRAGSIFVEALNRPDFADSNTIIYGHHMKNGSMFATLGNWADQEYYERHPAFWLLTPKRNYRIILFSGYTTTATSDAYTIYQAPCREFGDYLQAVYANSDFHADVEWDCNERFVMLSTCEYAFEGARYVLHGMLVPCDGEPVTSQE